MQSIAKENKLDNLKAIKPQAILDMVRPRAHSYHQALLPFQLFLDLVSAPFQYALPEQHVRGRHSAEAK